MSEKTYVFEPSQNTMPAWAPILGGNGGFFGGGMWEGIIGLIAISAIFGGNGGWGGRGCGSAERDMLMSAIQRNGTDVAGLAAQLNVSTSRVDAAIDSVALQVSNLAAQQGTNAMQIINSIQAGDAALANQIATSCCENRLAICQQTNALTNTMNANTLAIEQKLDSMQTQALQDKIDALREKNSTLTTQLNLEHQNAYTSGVVANAVAPITASLAHLTKEVNDIQCKLPSTATVPYSPVTAIPTCLAAQYGWYGAGPFGNNPYSNAAFWG